MSDLKQLVPIKESKTLPNQKSVSARELHQFLESKRQFANWIKERISKYGFEEGVDFVTFNKIVKRSRLTEYDLTLDMAKELSMVENNEKGRQARRYFIQCEKALRQAVHPKQFYTITEYINWKNISLTEFQESVLETRCIVASTEQKTPEKRQNGKRVFPLNMLQIAYQQLSEQIQAKQVRKRNEDVDIESGRVLMELRHITQSIIEKQRLQDFFISKNLMQEYYRYCER